MHHQRVVLFTASEALFSKVKKCIPKGFAEVARFHPEKFNPETLSGAVMALVDGNGHITSETLQLLEKLAAAAIHSVLLIEESAIGDDVPDILSNGMVDDILLMPLRPIEILSKIKHALYLARLDEIISANANLKDLITKLEEDLRTTRAIQKALIPEKFPQVPGMKVTHKYLSGMKSGGDYLDFFEFEDKTHVGILMSDSTGYGLSSAFMSVILKIAMKLSKDEARSPSATVSKIFEELQLTMKPSENFSIFYGILNRKTFELVYTGAGTIRIVHQDSDGKKRGEHALKPEALVKGEKLSLKDEKLSILPADRLILMSDGFSDLFDHRKSFDDAVELINDLTFKVKSKLESEDDMPEQDCSVMVIDAEKRAMRLAK